ncbi:metalloregulator ArsR/SmtB family transcription factor [Nocardioides panzhihuensis]|uniref:DNA-binding transcriptional ArsR family regulator n=1 Tax=Nocardioides panzhihuensis TaxID=860243 RepID=A0A7Z0DR47_9ACTN|nr:DNA-binding transcriptional ArsR family regulator [Nocardioides panzhihuensis]
MSTTPTLPEMCAALGDQTRWDILTRLGQEAMSASALARVLPVSRQAIVKHLDVLSEAGLVTAERRGREVVYAALGSRLNALAHELDRIGNAWDARLRALKTLAESPDKGGSDSRT